MPVALEIERRFLVRGSGWRPHIVWRQHLQQGYLQSSADGLTVRVRLQEDGPAAASVAENRAAGGPRAWLTLKSTLTAATRQEFEYPIPAEDAVQLLALAKTRLCKWRFGLDLPGGHWVLDQFEGDNAPLVLAEVELEREDQPVEVPDWCQREVTGRGELSNAALASRPWSHWSEAERCAWLGRVPGEADTIS
jgi:CYTH domain-containing protein